MTRRTEAVTQFGFIVEGVDMTMTRGSSVDRDSCGNRILIDAGEIVTDPQNHAPHVQFWPDMRKDELVKLEPSRLKAKRWLLSDSGDIELLDCRQVTVDVLPPKHELHGMGCDCRAVTAKLASTFTEPKGLRGGVKVLARAGRVVVVYTHFCSDHGGESRKAKSASEYDHY